MTQEDIIRMARKAGWMSEYESSTGFSAEAAFKFAALVAAAEREACAKLCDDNYFAFMAADAIRARGQA
jgi:hypothetical protein